VKLFGVTASGKVMIGFWRIGIWIKIQEFVFTFFNTMKVLCVTQWNQLLWRILLLGGMYYSGESH